MVSIFSGSLDPSVMSASIAEDKTEFLQIKGKLILTQFFFILFVSFFLSVLNPFVYRCLNLKFVLNCVT